MTDALVRRIDTLEMRVTHQDETIEALNKTITAQWAQLDGLKREITELRERLADAEHRSAAGPATEVPPHY